jgi:Tol biopolymer transport system component
MATVVAAIVLLAAAGIAYKFLGAKPAFNFQGMEISKLTQTGKASGVAVSPDGQYVVYVLRDGEKQSLMVRQVATGSDIPVVPAEIVTYYGMSFSPDGQYIYFVASSRENNFFSSLYKMPVLGGAPVKIVTDIDTSPSFSPDGKQFAFIRGVPEHGRVHLMVAKSDGSDVHVLFEKSAGVTPDNLVRAAWSPDGKTIVTTFYESNYRVTLTAIPVADPSKARAFFSTHDDVGAPVWLPDGSALLVVIRERAGSNRGQIWTVSYPDGQAHRLSNDLTNYSLPWLGLSRDASSLAAIENNRTADLWLAPDGDATRAHQIASAGSSIQSIAPFGKDRFLILTTNGELSSISADGSDSTRILGADQNVSFADGCGDGKHIVFQKRQGDDSSILRVDASGSNPKVLVPTTTFALPICSADGQSVYYRQEDSGSYAVSIDGGQPRKIEVPYASMGANIPSPDGQSLLYTWQDPANLANPVHFSIVPSKGGAATHTFDRMVGGGIVTWAPDGKSIDYLVTRGGVTNVWRQALSGGPAKQLTHFTSDLAQSFTWSGDAKTLAIARGSRTADIVLLKSPYKSQ